MLQVKCIFNFTCNLYLVVMFVLKCIFSMQYKSIAQVNEFALKQMESAHETFKIEVIWMLHYTQNCVIQQLFLTLFSLNLEYIRRMSKTIAWGPTSITQGVGYRTLLESECMLKSKEAAAAAAAKEEAISSAFSEIATLKDEFSAKM